MIIYCLAFLYLSGAYAEWLNTCSDIRNGLAFDELKIDCFKCVVENQPLSCYCFHLTKQDSMRCTHGPDYENAELCDPMYELIYDIRDNKAPDVFKDCEKQTTMVEKPRVCMNNGNITHGAYADVNDVLSKAIQEIDTKSPAKVDISRKVKFNAHYDLELVVKGSTSTLFELQCCANKMTSGCKVLEGTNEAAFRLVNSKYECKTVENPDPFSDAHVSNVLPLDISQLINKTWNLKENYLYGAWNVDIDCTRSSDEECTELINKMNCRFNQRVPLIATRAGRAYGLCMLVTEKCNESLQTVTDDAFDLDSSYYSRYLPSIEEISRSGKWEKTVDDWEASIECKKDDCKIIVGQLRCCSKRNVTGCQVSYHGSTGHYLMNNTVITPPDSVSYPQFPPPEGKDNWGKVYAWWDTRADTSPIRSATNSIWKNTIKTGVCYNGAFMARQGEATVKVWACNATQRDLDRVKEMMYEYIGYGIFGFKVNHGGAIARYELYDFAEAEIPSGYLDQDQNIICDKEKKWDHAQAKSMLVTTVSSLKAQAPSIYDPSYTEGKYYFTDIRDYKSESDACQMAMNHLLTTCKYGGQIWYHGSCYLRIADYPISHYTPHRFWYL